MTDAADDDSWDEYSAEFYADDCKCKHDPDDHGWDGCDEEGCECPASWVE